jgi:hypothetical protein
MMVISVAEFDKLELDSPQGHGLEMNNIIRGSRFTLVYPFYCLET